VVKEIHHSILKSKESSSYIIRKDSVPTSQKTLAASIRVTMQFMMCGEKIVIGFEII